jgi:hypothetical protein
MKNDSRKFHFRGQMEDEVVKDFYRRHWIVILPQIFMFLLFIVLIVTLIINLGGIVFPPFTVPIFEAFVILAIIGTGIIIHRFFMILLEYFMNVVVFTNNRVVVVRKTLFTHDDKESVYMREIQDIQKRQIGIIKNVFDYGELLINVGVPDLTILRMVPNPDYHFRLLNMIRFEGYAEKDKEEAKVKAKEEVKIKENIPVDEEEKSKEESMHQENVEKMEKAADKGEKDESAVDPLAEKRKIE